MSYFPDPNLNPVTVATANSPSIPTNIYTPSLSLGNLYVRSEYAPAYGLQVEKRYRNLSDTTLHTGDRVQVEISLKNTTNAMISAVEYLDTIPQIFRLPEVAKYRAILAGQSREDTINQLQ